MPRGGRREGAGGKFKWKHGKTKTIRVPEALVEKILEIVRFLDDGGNISIDSLSYIQKDDFSESKIIDLSNVGLVAINGQPSVRIIDLLKKGYEIKPKQISNYRSIKSAMFDSNN